MIKPVYSIVSASYNHSKYIDFFINSLLKQQVKEWELIITDDCSTDDSLKKLLSYNKIDSRIKVFYNQKNRQVCETLNNSLKHVNGDFICFLSADDAMKDNKIKIDLDYFKDNKSIDVLYTPLEIIDEHNKLVNKQYLLPQYNQNELLTKLYNGNCLLVPGMVIRRKCLNEIGYYNILLKLTQDYEYHVRLLFKFKCSFLSSATVLYRIHDNNLSINNQANWNTYLIEMGFVLKVYLQEIRTAEQLIKIFPHANIYGKVVDKLIPYFLGRLALESNNNAVRFWGISLLYDFMQDTTNIEILEHEYNFLGKDFMGLVSSCKIFYDHEFQPRKKFPLFKRLTKNLKYINIFKKNK